MNQIVPLDISISVRKEEHSTQEDTFYPVWKFRCENRLDDAWIACEIIIIPQDLEVIDWS